MPAKPENIGHFYFNSDYPADKVVWLREGSFTTASDGEGSFYIQYSLPDPYRDHPLFVKGVCSFDNWQTAMSFGSSYTTNDGYFCYANLYWNWDLGDPALMIGYDLHDRGGQTMQYRFWGVQREDIAFPTDFGRTAARSMNALKFDTGINYPRLIKDGVAKSGDVIAHNLGRIPYVDWWYTYSGNTDTLLEYWSLEPVGYFGAGVGPYVSVRADDKNLYFQQIKYAGDEEGSDVSYYYRIYG